MAQWKVYEHPNGYQEKVKDGFNWYVLLFGPLWFLFNKMVPTGLGWLLLALVLGLVTFGIGGLIVWIVAGFMANSQKEKKYLSEGWRFVGYIKYIP